MSRPNRIPRLPVSHGASWLSHVFTEPHEVRTHTSAIARAIEWVRRAWLLHRHHRLAADARSLDAGLRQDEQAVSYMRSMRRSADPILLSRITHERAELGRVRAQLTLVEHRLAAIGVRVAANDPQFHRIA
ncbi:hypothetical protein ACFJIX_17895 [Roseateles sp. UC29_93]|uniref:hypothetical protein n=1 Tax=Roseateles sp. UC29_93 TaxID=3350177 RepID=UPI0036729D5F